MIDSTVAKIFRELVPVLRHDAVVNPVSLFKKYEEKVGRIAEMLAREEQSVIDNVLSRLQLMYDNDRERKESIDRRAEIILLVNTGAIAGFVPIIVSQIQYRDLQESSFGNAISALLLAGIIYTIISFWRALSVHQRVMRHIVGLDEVIGDDNRIVRNDAFAQRMASLIVLNWKINNYWAERLEVARRCLRNGLVILIACASLTVMRLIRTSDNIGGAIWQ